MQKGNKRMLFYERTPIGVIIEEIEIMQNISVIPESILIKEGVNRCIILDFLSA